VRAALRGLDSRNAQRVAGHLVVAGTLVDDQPEEALAHARAARDRASRVAVVREAVGVAAYHAGDYAEAARELRAYRRMSGDEGYRAVLADCERALGRPEVALRLVREALAERPDAEETVELRLVEAGVRQDLGELPAARLVLESALGGRPRPDTVDWADPAVLRLSAAYADLLATAGQEALADQWHAAVVAHTPEESDVEFSEEDLPVTDADASEEDTGTPAGEEAVVASATDEAARAEADDADDLDADDLDTDDLDTGGYDFAEDVEAEVAELLGEDAAADDAAPEDAAPEDAAPEDAAPEDAAPEDAAPEDATPDDAGD
jgi:tetratricopeptide (TPR) repeat protein